METSLRTIYSNERESYLALLCKEKEEKKKKTFVRQLPLSFAMGAKSHFKKIKRKLSGD